MGATKLLPRSRSLNRSSLMHWRVSIVSVDLRSQREAAEEDVCSCEIQLDAKLPKTLEGVTSSHYRGLFTASNDKATKYFTRKMKISHFLHFLTSMRDNGWSTQGVTAYYDPTVQGVIKLFYFERFMDREQDGENMMPLTSPQPSAGLSATPATNSTPTPLRRPSAATSASRVPPPSRTPEPPTRNVPTSVSAVAAKPVETSRPEPTVNRRSSLQRLKQLFGSAGPDKLKQPAQEAITSLNTAQPTEPPAVTPPLSQQEASPPAPQAMPGPDKRVPPPTRSPPPPVMKAEAPSSSSFLSLSGSTSAQDKSISDKLQSIRNLRNMLGAKTGDKPAVRPVVEQPPPAQTSQIESQRDQPPPPVVKEVQRAPLPAEMLKPSSPLEMKRSSSGAPPPPPPPPDAPVVPVMTPASRSMPASRDLLGVSRKEVPPPFAEQEVEEAVATTHSVPPSAAEMKSVDVPKIEAEDGFELTGSDGQSALEHVQQTMSVNEATDSDDMREQGRTEHFAKLGSAFAFGGQSILASGGGRGRARGGRGRGRGSGSISFPSTMN